MNSLFKSSIAAIIGVIAIWQLIVSLTGVPRFILPSPFLVGVSFVENFELIIPLWQGPTGALLTRGPPGVMRIGRRESRIELLSA